MVRNFLLSAFCLLTGVTNAQYHITYKEIRQDSRPLIDEINISHYYIKDGAYINERPLDDLWLQSYSANTGMTGWATIDGSVDYRPMTSFPVTDIEISKLDTTTTILGYKCRAIQVKINGERTVYFISDELTVDPNSFKAHTLSAWNKIISFSGGALPLAYTTERDGSAISVVALDVEKIEKWTDDLGKFKKQRLEALSKSYEEWESRFKNKYRENLKLRPEGFHSTGVMHVNNMQLPMEIDYEEPERIRIILDFMGAKFIIGSNEDYSWVHDGINSKTTKTPNSQNDSKTGVHELIRQIAFPEVTNIRSVDLVGEKLYISFFERGLFKRVRIDTELLLADYTENAKTILRLSDYYAEDGFLLPSKWKIWSADNPGMEFRLKTIEEKTGLPETHYMLPDSLLVKEEVQEKNADSYFNDGEALLANESYAEAISQYRKVIEIDPRHHVAFNQLGFCLLQEGDKYGAIANFTRASEIQPDYAVSWANLAYVKSELGDYSSAIESYTRAIASDNNAGYYSNRGQCHYKLDSMSYAIADFRRAISLDETRSLDLFNLGVCYRELNNNDSAIHFLDRALKLEKVSDIYNERGLTYYQMEDFERALVDFIEAYDLESDLVILENIGDTYAELEQYDKAIESYQGILKEDSERHDVHYYIGNQYANDDDFADAIHHYSLAIDLYDKEALYFDARGKAYYNSMKFSQAAEDFTQSLVLYPDDPEIYYLRATAKINLSDNFDGCKDYKKAMDLGYEAAEAQFEEHCSFLGN